MTPELWQKVDSLFERALEVPADERQAWLENACGGDAELLREVQSLLQYDQPKKGLGTQIYSEALDLIKASDQFRMPERVGPYRLVRELGHGGMGAVYLGRRDDEQYQMDVAVKLLNPGTVGQMALQRFRRERQILATLDHPNIARLLDGGATEAGEPYIVMEFIDGVPITEYCRREALGVERILELFLPVCLAVEHAHRNFVVHRDVKPGNILVNKEGAPKLLDFGISKLLESDAPASTSETMVAGLRMLTPDYASPEQIRGEPVTIPSDVYSLGAVLYELLTDHKPHALSSLSMTEVERVVSETNASRPSLVAREELRRRLQGDLDTILLRALDKDRNRRYATVTDFRADLERHLQHLPVLARPDTLTYRAGKLLRRRRGAVAAVAAVAASLLIGSAVAINQARIANERLQQVRRLANVFVFDVHESIRDLPGATKARELIVSTGLEYLDSLAKTARNDSTLQLELARAYLQIAEIQSDGFNSNLGKVDAGEKSLGKARALIEAVLARHPDETAARRGLISVYAAEGRHAYQSGDATTTRRAYEQVVALAPPVLAALPGDEKLRRVVSQAYAGLALVVRTAEPKQAVAYAKRWLEVLRTSPEAARDPEWRYLMASGMSALGNYELAAGLPGSALEHMRESAGEMQQLLREFPHSTVYKRQEMLLWSHIADALTERNEMKEAAAAGERFVAIARSMFEADKADVRAGIDLGIALTRQAELLPDDAWARRKPLLQEAVGLLQTGITKNPKHVQARSYLASATIGLGNSLAESGDRGGAVQQWRTGSALAEPMLGRGSAYLMAEYAQACRRLGEAAAAQGDKSMAERFEQKLEAASAAKGPAAAQAAAIVQANLGLLQARLAPSAGKRSGAPADRLLESRTRLEHVGSTVRLPGVAPLLREIDQTLRGLGRTGH